MKVNALAMQMRFEIRSQIDAPENADEREDLQLLTHAPDWELIRWWIACPFCKEWRHPSLTKHETELCIELARHLDHFEALVETMQEYIHWGSRLTLDWAELSRCSSEPGCRHAL